VRYQQQRQEQQQEQQQQREQQRQVMLCEWCVCNGLQRA
jgi:hypothetical protein